MALCYSGKSKIKEAPYEAANKPTVRVKSRSSSRVSSDWSDPAEAQRNLQLDTTLAEIHSSPPQTPNQEKEQAPPPSSEFPASSRASSRSNLPSRSISEQTLRTENPDQITPQPKEKSRWFKLSGKGGKDKSKSREVIPQPQQPPTQSKSTQAKSKSGGKIPKNLPERLLRTSGEALRTYKATMDKNFEIPHLTEAQLRKTHEGNRKKAMQQFDDEFHRLLQSSNQTVFALILDEHTKLEQDIKTLFEQCLKQHQQRQNDLQSSMSESTNTLNNLSPDPVSPTPSTPSPAVSRSDNQSVSSTQSLDDFGRVPSIKGINRWSFPAFASKSKSDSKSLKESDGRRHSTKSNDSIKSRESSKSPDSSKSRESLKNRDARSPSPQAKSPSSSTSEREAKIQEQLQKLNKMISHKSAEALKAYKTAMDDVVSNTSQLTDDKIKSSHAACSKLVLNKFSADFKDYMHSRNRSAVTMTRNAMSNLESDINSNLASYLQKYEEKKARGQAKRMMAEAELFYERAMLNYRPSQHLEEDVKLKHYAVVQESLEYFDSLMKKQGWVVPSTWQNEIQTRLDEKFQDILLQRSLHEDEEEYNERKPGKSTHQTPRPEIQGTAAQLEINVRKLGGNAHIMEKPENNSMKISKPEDIKTKTSQDKNTKTPESNSSVKTKLAGKSSSASSLNIGIYLDQSSVIIGTMNHRNAREPEILKSALPEITFTDFALKLGKPESNPNENHFNICELIFAPPAPRSILLRAATYVLTTEEILTLFFERLFAEIKLNKNFENIGNAVITVPYVATSLEKERIKQSLLAAGADNVRVLSSLVATAAAYAQETNFYANPTNMSKLILVVQPVRKAFSMAIIAVKPLSIITKGGIGSENMKDGQSKTFENCHRHLMQNGQVKKDQIGHIGRTYRTALKHLLGAQTDLDAVIAIRTAPTENQIDPILRNIFGENTLQNKLVIQGPLVGACLLASKGFLPASVIPPNLEIYDASRSDLQIMINGKILNLPDSFRNQEYHPGLIFKKPLNVPPNPNNCSFVIVLKEIFQKEHFVTNVGKWVIDVENPGRAKGKEIELRCLTDQDGILKLDASCSPELQAFFHREDPIMIECEPGSMLDKIYSYYNPSGNKQAFISLRSPTIEQEVAEKPKFVYEDDVDEEEPLDSRKETPISSPKKFDSPKIQDPPQPQPREPPIQSKPQPYDQYGLPETPTRPKYPKEAKPPRNKKSDPEKQDKLMIQDYSEEPKVLTPKPQEPKQLEFQPESPTNKKQQIKLKQPGKPEEQISEKKFEEIVSEPQIQQTKSTSPVQEKISVPEIQKKKSTPEIQDRNPTPEIKPENIQHEKPLVQVHVPEEELSAMEKEAIKVLQAEKIDKIIDKKLNTAVEDGIQYYKQVLTAVLNTDMPYTDRQVKDFHQKTLEAILSGFSETLNDGEMDQTKISPPVRKAKERLEKTINLHLPYILEKNRATVAACAAKQNLELSERRSSSSSGGSHDEIHGNRKPPKIHAEPIAEASKPKSKTASATKILKKFIPAGIKEKIPETPKDKTPKVPKEGTPEVPKDKTPEVLKNKTPEVPKTKPPKIPEEKTPEVPITKPPEVHNDKIPEVPITKPPEVHNDKIPEVPITKPPEVHNDKIPEVPITKPPQIPKEATPEVSKDHTPEVPPAYEYQPLSPPKSPNLIGKTVDGTLIKFVEEGIKHHKNLMSKITDSPKPYTDSQIISFHQDNLLAVLKAFDSSVLPLQTSDNTNTGDAVIVARQTLTNQINSLLSQYLSKYETTITEVKKKVKRWELEGECLYDDEMEAFDPKTKTEHQVGSRHQEIRIKVLNNFVRKILEAGLEWDDLWKAELEWRMETKLEEALLECVSATSLEDTNGEIAVTTASNQNAELITSTIVTSSMIGHPERATFAEIVSQGPPKSPSYPPKSLPSPSSPSKIPVQTPAEPPPLKILQPRPVTINVEPPTPPTDPTSQSKPVALQKVKVMESTIPLKQTFQHKTPSAFIPAFTMQTYQQRGPVGPIVTNPGFKSVIPVKGSHEKTKSTRPVPQEVKILPQAQTAPTSLPTLVSSKEKRKKVSRTSSRSSSSSAGSTPSTPRKEQSYTTLYTFNPKDSHVQGISAVKVKEVDLKGISVKAENMERNKPSNGEQAQNVEVKASVPVNASTVGSVKRYEPYKFKKSDVAKKTSGPPKSNETAPAKTFAPKLSSTVNPTKTSGQAISVVADPIKTPEPKISTVATPTKTSGPGNPIGTDQTKIFAPVTPIVADQTKIPGPGKSAINTESPKISTTVRSNTNDSNSTKIPTPIVITKVQPDRNSSTSSIDSPSPSQPWTYKSTSYNFRNKQNAAGKKNKDSVKAKKIKTGSDSFSSDDSNKKIQNTTPPPPASKIPVSSSPQAGNGTTSPVKSYAEVAKKVEAPNKPITQIPEQTRFPPNDIGNTIIHAARNPDGRDRKFPTEVNKPIPSTTVDQNQRNKFSTVDGSLRRNPPSTAPNQNLKNNLGLLPAKQEIDHQKLNKPEKLSANPIQNMPVNSNTNQTPPPTVDRNQMKIIQEILSSVEKDAVKYHNEQMKDLINQRKPFTRGELEKFHTKQVKSTLAAYNAAFENVWISNFPNFQGELNKSKETILKTLNAQLEKHGLQYDTIIEKILTNLKQLTADAENLYDSFMDEIKPRGKLQSEILTEHAKIKDEVTTIFKEQAVENNGEWQETWQLELDHKLQEKLMDLLDEAAKSPDEMPGSSHGQEGQSTPMEIESSSANPGFKIPEANPQLKNPAGNSKNNEEVIYENIHSLNAKRAKLENVGRSQSLTHEPAGTSVNSPEEERQSMKIYHSILKKPNAPSPTKPRVNFGFPGGSQKDLQDEPRSLRQNPPAMSTFHVENRSDSRPQKAIRTKSLPDLDSSRSAGQFVTASIKRPAMAPPPVPTKRVDKINVGIYLDEHFANVGTFLNNDVNEVDLILQIPAEIAFLDNEIAVGWQAERNRNSYNHFYLYHLIKIKFSEVHPVHVSSTKHSPCTEEIIAMYFKKLHHDISLVKRGAPVGNVVITVPFTLTSAEKERIKIAARIAGLQNVRVISTMVTMAVAFARESNYYLGGGTEPKIILVVHYLKHSFSMATVEIRRNSITTKSCYGSENMPEGHQVQFLKTHALMFTNGRLNQKEDFYIQNVYKRAMYQLSSGSTPVQWDRIFVVKGHDTTKIDKVLDNLFGKQNQARGYLDGPLLGACLLACKNHLNIPLIPVDLEVNDASRSHLVLQSVSGQTWRKHFRNHIFKPEIIFRFPLAVPPEGTVIVLEEEFIPESEPTRVGRYQVIARRDNDRSCDVVLNCAVDEDGVFTLGIDYTQAVVEGYVVRIDQLFVNASDQENPFSGFSKLSQHYQQFRGTLV